MSLLTVIRNAVAGGAEDEPREAAHTGATAPEGPAGAEGVDMPTETQPAGGANAGISQADHDAAVNAARDQGRAEGVQAATDRLAAALGAEGVRGNAARMSAALDLAQKSPGMDGAAIAAFVSANVAAEPVTAPSYEAQRLAAAGLAAPAPRAGSTKDDEKVARILANQRQATGSGGRAN